MEPAKILVVEDEPVVAKDIQVSLQRLGYRVPALASSGEDALYKVAETHPDLALMDIVLKGKMDGVETAQRIKEHFDVPVIYLTAYADEHTFERAKVTCPLGYLLKPYQPKELRTTIELALHRVNQDRDLKGNLQWLATTVRCIGDAVITTDQQGQVTYLNPAAESLTGWSLEEVKGNRLTTIMSFNAEAPVHPIVNPAIRAIADQRMINVETAVILAKDGSRRSIQGSAAPVLDQTGIVLGSVLVFHPLGMKPCPTHTGSNSSAMLDQVENQLTGLRGIVNLCAWCKRVPDVSGEWYDLETFVAERSSVHFNGGLCPECMEKCFPRS